MLSLDANIPIYIYIADFYCHSRNLVVEVDGPNHNTPQHKNYDRVRSQAFQEFKIDIIRFTNDQVLNDIYSVINEINNKIALIASH